MRTDRPIAVSLASKIEPSALRLLDTRLQDRCLARLGLGDRRAALFAAAHRLGWCGSLSVCVPPIIVDEAWLKKGLPCS